MKASNKHILIADDHGVVRYGVALLIKDLLSGVAVSQVGCFDETLTVIKGAKVDLLILDINLPGGNNVQMLETLDEIQPGLKVLMFSGYDEKVYATRYLQAGAKGYLYKQTSNEQIKTAIKSVLAGGIYVSDDVKELMLGNLLNHSESPNPLDILSNREFEVAQLLVCGNGVTEIANALNLQLSTVSTYKNRIYEKLNVINLVQLIDKLRLWSIPVSN